jgi:anaerobic ribonucleoside-triphosphate reductase
VKLQHQNKTKVKLIENEVYSRVCGYYRPVKMFNLGKSKEFSERKLINIKDLRK